MSRAPLENQLDTEALKRAATDVIKALKGKISGETLKFRQSPMKDSWTDGWYVTIGKMGVGLPDLQIFLDRMNGPGKRHFWFGFAANQLAPVTKAKDAYCRPISKREIGDADLTETPKGYCLTKPLQRTEIGTPILELFDKIGLFYFGIYDVEPGSANSVLNVSLAMDFFLQVMRHLLKEDSGRIEPLEYEFFRRLKRDRQTKFRNLGSGPISG